MRLRFCLALSLLTPFCSGLTQPTPRSETAVPIFSIVPAIESLKIGATERLSVVATSGTTQRTVPAVWSSEKISVAMVSDDGVASAVAEGSTAILAVAEGQQLRQAIRVVPDHGGLWTGTRRIVGCQRLSGAGPDVCRFVLVGGGAVLPVSVKLTHAASSITGTLELLTGSTPNESGQVLGSFSETGALQLMGSIQNVSAGHFSETTIGPGDWTTTLTAGTHRMTGRFIRNHRQQNAWGLQHIREECDLTLVRAQ